MDEDGEYADHFDNLSDISEIITESEGEMEENQQEEDVPTASGNYFPNPWFSVVDRETFVLSDVREFNEESGPVAMEPTFTPIDYFNRFILSEEFNLIECLVEETNRYHYYNNLPHFKTLLRNTKMSV